MIRFREDVGADASPMAASGAASVELSDSSTSGGARLVAVAVAAAAVGDFRSAFGEKMRLSEESETGAGEKEGCFLARGEPGCSRDGCGTEWMMPAGGAGGSSAMVPAVSAGVTGVRPGWDAVRGGGQMVGNEKVLFGRNGKEWKGASGRKRCNTI